jgi:hypothetical protein
VNIPCDLGEKRLKAVCHRSVSPFRCARLESIPRSAVLRACRCAVVTAAQYYEALAAATTAPHSGAPRDEKQDEESTVAPLSPHSPSNPQTAARARPGVRVMAVVSLLCGILSLLLIGLILAGLFPSAWSLAPSLVCGAIGAAFGHLVRRVARRSSDVRLATAGLVLSYGGALLSIALVVALAWALDSAGPFPPGN